jgi:hypothetical protein
MNASSFGSAHRVISLSGLRAVLFGLGCILAVGAFAQQEGQPPPDATEGSPADGRMRGQGRRGNFDPEEMRARISQRLREQLEVTDDAEWQLIMERITKVTELRRGVAGGGLMFARGGNGGDRQGGGAGNAEQSALQQAVKDKLPDAEIKARIVRLRESRKQNEAKLAQAQEELRAVLSVRQEAIAVLYGMLP